MRYRRVRDSEIDPVFWLAVHDHAREACAELHIDMPPAIIFIEPSASGEISYRREILAGAMGTRLSFRTDIPRDRLREVVRHECRHAWQHEHPKTNYGDPEQDAEAFARRPEKVAAQQKTNFHKKLKELQI